MKRNNSKSSIYILLSTIITILILSVVSYVNYEENSEETTYNGIDPVEITEKFIKQKEQINRV